MWQYVSEKICLKSAHWLLFERFIIGGCYCVSAHNLKALCAVGILHCDISAGNVLLTEAQNGRFISDLEFARIQDSTIRERSAVENINFNPQRILTEGTQRTHTAFHLSHWSSGYQASFVD